MGLTLGKITVETPKYEVLSKSQAYEIREYVPSLIAEVTYDPSQIKDGRSGGFYILANYIGALGKPCNVKVQAKEGVTGEQSEKIAMTTPVLMKEQISAAQEDGEKVAMTAPVLIKEQEPSVQECEKIAMTAPVLTSEAISMKASEEIKMTAPVLTHESDGKVAKESKKLMSMQFVLPSQYTMDIVPRPTDPRVSVKQLPARKYGVATFSGIAQTRLTEQKAQELRKALQEARYKITGDYILAQYNPPWTIPFLRRNEILIPVDP